MKKLIVYDDSCPMCRFYTKGMVIADSGLTRVSNGALTNTSLLNRVDRQRARHEIPLIDLDGGETQYGIDTWAYTFGRKNRLITGLVSGGWSRVVLQKLYAFISFNRRIIVPAAPGRPQLLDLAPDFRLNYRLAFVVLTFGLTGALFFTPGGSAAPIIILLIGQLLLAGLITGLKKGSNQPETILDYAGHLGMSLLAGGLLIRLGMAIDFPVVVRVGYALAIGQHFIRVYRLGLTPWLSVGFTSLFLLVLPY